MDPTLLLSSPGGLMVSGSQIWNLRYIYRYNYLLDIFFINFKRSKYIVWRTYFFSVSNDVLIEADFEDLNFG